MTPGEFIKFRRIEKNYILKDLAKLCNTSDVTLSRIENNKAPIDFTLLMSICGTLDFTPDELAQRTGYKLKKAEDDHFFNTEKIEGKIEELAEKVVRQAFEKVIEKNKNFDIHAVMRQLNISLPVVGKKVTLPLVKNVHCGNLNSITEVSELMEIPPSWEGKGDFCPGSW